ncbi:MAG TPA: autotransporter domain-containing protein [Burkholderiaceae bacterium]|nr:autotransporter domain-containing protein [Burkholderiaceae bacterium]
MAAISAASIHGSASATACGEIGGVYTKTGAETCTIEPGSAFTAVIVENGGLLLPSGSVESTILNIAANVGASGTVTISGSGARWNADAVVLGDPDGSGRPTGVNSLHIVQGGAMEADFLVAGGQTGSNHVLVTGQNSSLTLRESTSASISLGTSALASLTIADNARVVAAGNLELGEYGALNIGAAPGSAPVAPGKLSAADISGFGGSPGGSINFNHTGNNYVFDADIGMIANIEAINQWAGNTVLNGSHFTNGPTNVYGGSLTVNGDLDSSSLTVHSGGTVGGIGEIPPSLIKSGGTLWPGNPEHELTVCCHLTFESGSFFKVGVDPANGTSDFVLVAGDAYLNGTVVPVLLGSGPHPTFQSYPILGAADSIHGRFDGIDFPYAFLDASLYYDEDPSGHDTVFLDIQRNSTRFADAAYTGNQRNVANAIESMPAENPVYQAALLQRKGQAPGFFNALSGEIHATTPAMLFNTSQYISKLPFAYLRNNLDAGMVPGAPMASAGTSIPRAAMPQSAALPLWADVVASRQRLSGGDETASSTATSHGLFVGGDTPIAGGWRLGAALGYMHSRSKVDERNSSARVDSASIALYAGKSMAVEHGKINLLLGAAYTRHGVRSTRRIALESGQQTLQADYAATAAQLFAELGYAVPWGPATVEPFVNLTGSQLRTPAFSESGGWAALHSDRSRNAVGSATLGVRGNIPLELGRAQARVDASLAWRHAAGDVKPQSTMAFSEGSRFTVNGTPIARDAALVGLGLGLQVGRRALLSLSYAGEFGRGATEHSGKLNLNWAF